MALGFFALHLMVLLALITGFRYAVTVPAELASNWTIRMAWLGDERGYQEAQACWPHRARDIAAALAPAATRRDLWPHHRRRSFAVRVLSAIAILDSVFLGYRKLPFACSHVPIENPKLLWPTAVASLLLVAYGFAYVERFALTDTDARGGAVRDPWRDRYHHQADRSGAPARAAAGEF